jgi:hypothetical protein
MDNAKVKYFENLLNKQLLNGKKSMIYTSFGEYILNPLEAQYSTEGGVVAFIKGNETLFIALEDILCIQTGKET